MEVVEMYTKTIEHLRRGIHEIAAAGGLGILMALALLAAACPAAGRAAELAVTRTDDPVPDSCQPADCSLREAVIAANGRGGADTIRLVPGSYTLSQPRPAAGDFGFAQVGDLDVDEDLAIEGPPLGAASTAGGGTRATVDGNGAVIGDRVFEVDAGGSLRLRRLRIVGGEAQKTDDDNGDGVPDFARGGAVRIEAGGALDLEHDLLAANTAEAFGQGGAIYNAGELRVSDSLFTYNQAVEGFSGAIHTAPGASADLARADFEANVAGFGGAIGAYGITTLTDSDLIANHAGIGGAIRAGGANSLTTLANVTLAHNDSTGDGAAIRARDGAGLFLDAVTIARNTADVDGTGDGDAAIALRRDTLATGAELRNTILAANEDGSPGAGGVPDCEVSGGAAIVFAGYDLLGDRHGCELTIPLGTDGNQLPNSGFALDSGLDLAAAENGGPTRTLALLPGSRAIDAGDPAPPGAAGACPVADQRGEPRLRCDIGAFELQPREAPAEAGPQAPTGGAGSPGTAGSPSTTAPADTTAPLISHASLSRRRFRVGREPTALVARRRAAVGARVRFGLSEASRVSLRMLRLLPGRRVRRSGRARCARPTPRLRHKHGCVRRRRAGVLRRGLPAGEAEIPFSGRIGRRALRPGRYRLRISAVDRAGNRSRTAVLPFVVVAKQATGGGRDARPND